MGSERVHVHDLAGVVWHRQWQSANATARLGELGNRWIAWHSQRGGFAYWTERAACDRLDRMLARGDWRELDRAVTAQVGASAADQ